MNNDFKVLNAVELWKVETAHPAIPTLCMAIDNALGTDGPQLGTLTEVIGLPGTGKTQFCMQLCTSVQIPKDLGGLDAEALYIDTNLNFTINRFQDIVKGHIEKCQRILGNAFNKNESDILSKFHYIKAIDLVQFLSAMHMIPQFLEENPNVRLIVIDSLTFPFYTTATPRQRTGHLFRIMAELQSLAVLKRIAVVVTNSMSTRVGLSSGAVVGAMGDGWAQRSNVRLLLHQEARSAQRVALVMKSNVAKESVAAFQITEQGIRDTGQ